MTRISDALELLTAQHEEIDELLAVVMTSTDAGARDRTLGVLADRLTAHLAIEQELVYPAVATVTAPGIVDELMAEHGEIKRVLAELLWFGLEDPANELRLGVLRGLLDGHCGWQEEQLFTTVAEAMSSRELAGLGAHIHAWFGDDLGLARAA